MTTEKKEILITGVGGALAHKVIEKLKNKHRIIGVGFQKESHEDPSIKYYHIDYSKRGFEEVFRNHNISCVIHLGRILLNESNRYRRFNVNVLGTKKLFDLSVKYNIHKIIILSTFHVYGAHAYNPTFIDEMFPLTAVNDSSNLSDAVELEHLSTIYMLKYPQLNIAVLRPTNIVGPGINNTISMLLKKKYAACLLGFSPMMQFIHVDDVATAINLVFYTNSNGAYNVVFEDWVPYQKALELAGCKLMKLPSVPTIIPKLIVKYLRIKEFPSFLINYYKYPVILDGSLFEKTFNFKPKYCLDDIFSYYRKLK